MNQQMQISRKDISGEGFYVIDSFAWVEYFGGTEKGEKAKQYVESGNAVTPTIVIAELSNKYARENLEFGEKLQFIRFNTRIALLTEDIANKAGKINAERRKFVKGWPLADSIVLTTAKELSAKIITGDEHFEDLPEAIII